MGYRGKLRGRDRDVQFLEDALSATAAGFGQTVVVSAGAGTGKTALLDEVVSRAMDRGFGILRAGGNRAEEVFPLTLARRLIPRDMNLEEPADARIATGATGDLRAPAEELWALSNSLYTLAGDSPILVAVDDCQWSDPVSLRWLSSLPQLIASMRILFVAVIAQGTYSDLAAVEDIRAAANIELHPGCLDRTATAAVLADICTRSPSSALVDTCHDLTGGNPMLLIDVARALAERGTYTADLDDLYVPALGTRLHSRLRNHYPHGLEIAESVAVLGANGTSARVAVTVGLEPATVHSELTALHQAGLVHLAGDLVQCAFPIVGSALLDQMDQSRRHRLRARAARIVAATGGQSREVAELLAGNGDLPDEPWARTALLEAADAAARQGDPDAAVRYYRSVLDHHGAGSDIAHQVDLGAVLARVNVSAATEYLVAAADHEASLPQRERIHRLLGELDSYLDSRGPTAASARQVRSPSPVTADPRPAPGTAEIPAKLIGPFWMESLPALAAGLVTATAQCWAGESPSNAARIAKAVMQNPIVPGHLLTAIQAATVVYECGDLDHALGQVEEITTAARRWQDRPAEAMALSLRSVLRRDAGALGPALQDAAASLALLRACMAHPASAHVTLARARYLQLLVDHGFLERAMSVLQADRHDSSGTMAGLQMALVRARLLAVAGHPRDAIRRLIACGEVASMHDVKNPAVLPWQPAVAVLLKAIGAGERARTMADDAVTIARQAGNRGSLSRALRAQGVVRGGTEGQGQLQEATEVVADTPYVLERALALTDYGALLVQSGDKSRGKAVLRVAAPLAYECGLPPLVQRVVDAYSAGGGRLNGGHFPGVTLTNAELRVAQLAAVGNTNREIARSLFVGLRTVEIHLSSAYRKLRVSGRAGLAQALERHGDQAGQPAPETC
jgi:DNA-binding CsgD family transcriptional regulator